MYPKSKNLNMRTHFKSRFQQRFGQTINSSDYRRIIDMIQNNEAEFVGRQSVNKSIFRVTYKDVSFYVVYNKQRKELHTCMPLDYDILIY